MHSITEHTIKTARHTTAYLACGPSNGNQIFLLHGWPELSLSWRHQLHTLGNLGYRVIAPDMRGYGKSSVYTGHRAYRMSECLLDMIELWQGLGEKRTVWIGHDWGSPVVWTLAKCEPQMAAAIGNLCVPLGMEGGINNWLPLIDRTIYPEATFPAGQWDYQLFYEENFAKAQQEMDSDPYKVIKMLFRKGDPAGTGKPSFTAFIRRNGGWTKNGELPDEPLDTDVVTEQEARVYSSSLERNSFFGPCSWYMNHKENAEFDSKHTGNHIFQMPTLFLHAKYDYVCETSQSRLADPMRKACPNLTEETIESGHWMAQERPVQVTASINRWIIKQSIFEI